jgi:formylmethanofuran dehydrogenase subunit D
MKSMIETEQKLIQIGSSEGITLSKKDLSRLGAKRGDTLKVRVELVNKHRSHDKLLDEYKSFVDKYGETLENLADE